MTEAKRGNSLLWNPAAVGIYDSRTAPIAPS